MSYYAKVNEGIVEQVIVAEANFFDTFIDNSPGKWILLEKTMLVKVTLMI